MIFCLSDVPFNLNNNWPFSSTWQSVSSFDKYELPIIALESRQD